MIKCHALPDVIFETQKALFHSLLDNEQKILAVKKASIVKSFDKGQLSYFGTLKDSDAQKADWMDSDYLYPVINTTKFLDHHEDVHFDGIWNKSIKEVAKSLMYVMSHEISIKDIISWPGEVEAFVKSVPWAFIGKEYNGNTNALMFKIHKDNIDNSDAKRMIDKKRPVQGSVRMQYVKTRLAINSTDIAFKDHKDYFDQNIEMIANKDLAISKGFFWGQEEAKIIKEGSMVLFGSNEATPIKNIEAVNDTSENEPSSDTQNEQKSYYSGLI